MSQVYKYTTAIVSASAGMLDADLAYQAQQALLAANITVVNGNLQVSHVGGNSYINALVVVDSSATGTLAASLRTAYQTISGLTVTGTPSITDTTAPPAPTPSVGGGGGGGGAGPNFMDNETPVTWTSNLEYILSHTPNPLGSLAVSIDDTVLGANGCNKLLVQGVDYHLGGTGNTHILYDVIPAATNKIRCSYRY